MWKGEARRGQNLILSQHEPPAALSNDIGNADAFAQYQRGSSSDFTELKASISKQEQLHQQPNRQKPNPPAHSILSKFIGVFSGNAN